MTDVWCFTCSHEIRQTIDGTWEHVDQDELRHCACAEIGEDCEPL